MSDTSQSTGPKWYLHEPFMLGADVPDGREGRWADIVAWRPAEACRLSFPHLIFETRPVPERMVAIDLPESVVRSTATWGVYGPSTGAVGDACRAAVERLDGGS